jgi:uncharacterized integral membrane protein
MMNESEMRKKVIMAIFKKATILMVVIYVVIIVFDALAHPRYPAWVVGVFAIVGFLVGTANGFLTAFKVRFSTVMHGRSDGQMISEIRTGPKKGSGVDDEG